jgi:hypothetical protein
MARGAGRVVAAAAVHAALTRLAREQHERGLPLCEFDPQRPFAPLLEMLAMLAILLPLLASPARPAILLR